MDAILNQVWEECTVVNVVLIVVILYLFTQLITPNPATHSHVKNEPEPEIAPREYTLEDLRKFDGCTPSKEHNGRKPIYMAVKGTVFDVSRGADFYGPGGPYAIFAGRDASRGLATYDLTDSAVKDTMDDLSDLTPDEIEVLDGWQESFTLKYIVRGNLVEAHQVKEQ
eukprot:m.25252 g.25252  ORF g.25252 m.25252 type:complete len:168 (-) comp7690_c0_seq1:3385-3888(-)